MDTLSKYQCHPTQHRTPPRVLRRLWLNLVGAKSYQQDIPVALDNLSPHLQRDIGLETRVATTPWLDSTALIGRHGRGP